MSYNEKLGGAWGEDNMDAHNMTMNIIIKESTTQGSILPCVGSQYRALLLLSEVIDNLLVSVLRSKIS